MGSVVADCLQPVVRFFLRKDHTYVIYQQLLSVSLFSHVGVCDSLIKLPPLFIPFGLEGPEHASFYIRFDDLL